MRCQVDLDLKLISFNCKRVEVFSSFERRVKMPNYHKFFSFFIFSIMRGIGNGDRLNLD